MQTAFHDLPRSMFPFKVEFIDRHDRVVHTITVEGPGAMHVPGLIEQYGPVGTRITYANGRVGYIPPPSE